MSGYHVWLLMRWTILLLYNTRGFSVWTLQALQVVAVVLNNCHRLNLVNWTKVLIAHQWTLSRMLACFTFEMGLFGLFQLLQFFVLFNVKQNEAEAFILERVFIVR